MAWSPDGKQLATIGRDHVIRIYNPRNSTSPINEGVGPEGSQGARVVWLSNTHLVVSGFNRSVYIYMYIQCMYIQCMYMYILCMYMYMYMCDGDTKSVCLRVSYSHSILMPPFS